jgi:soluble lytic murein transglycosylase-like protein
MNHSTKLRMNVYGGLNMAQRRAIRKAMFEAYRDSDWNPKEWTKILNTQAKKYGVPKNTILAVMNE